MIAAAWFLGFIGVFVIVYPVVDYIFDVFGSFWANGVQK